MVHLITVIVLSISLCITLCDAFKILVVFPFPAGSHCNLGDGYVRHLLKAGHEVTYITPFPKKNSNQNLRQINVADNIYAVNGQALNVQALMKHEVEMDQDLLFHMTVNVTKKTFENAAVQKLLNDPSEHFDVVIAEWMFNEIYSGVAAVFNCPLIWSFPYEPNFVGLSLIDEASNPAYSANIQFSDIPPFTFTQRVFALWFQIMHRVKYFLFYEKIETDVYENIFKTIVEKRGGHLQPYKEFKYSAAMILGNSHVSLGQAMRLPQNYVPIAGYHIDDVTPLPEDLKFIMDNAKNGVIYFSLGSNLKSKDLPTNIKKNLLKMFAELKQTVIWKFEEALPDLPTNVHILQWAPQTSILAHPSCILFITHGGLLSTTEAVHFGVPSIGIPVFFDQNFNVDQAVRRGITLKVMLSENCHIHLKNAIQDMLENPKYRQKMKELSFVYHHRPVPPGKLLVHWVEHVVRTNGAPHYRSVALLLPWYQKMYLDLIVTYITPFPYESSDPNLRLITTGDTVNAISGSSLNITALMLHEVEMDQDRHFQLAINITKNTLKNKSVQKLLNDPSESFDVIVAEWMFNDVYCGFSALFRCPYIWSFPYETNSISLGLLGEFSNPAYTANIETSDVPPFDFWQRVYSLWFRITSRVQHLLFSALFRCPYIWSFPYETNSISLGLLGEFSNPAYTANIETSDVPPFDFWQRVYSLWFRITSRVQHLFFYENIEKNLYEEIFSPILKKRGITTLPEYDILRYNASLILGNTDPSIGQALALPENYIPIAGYHIDEVKPLPQDLKDILDDAKHGVIYFSLGSNLKSKDFPEKILQDLLKLFGELQQTVIWKFEESLTNKPANVHILKWAPQQSILAHPNCVLFITHGGMLSVTEAVHFSVPFIGLPVFYDQNFNVAKSVQRGFAIKVSLSLNLAVELKDAVQEILNNNTYREAMKQTSITYHNRMIPSGDELVYWVEYVVRSNGAPHYRSAAFLLPWYQKMYLDFIAMVIACVCLFIYMIKTFCIKSKVQKIKSS
ncbi:UDP-glucuronosyltransferase 2B15 [Papilio xuthus]|uniref:UDP-glucuronosyltransferase 2B15 n=1 Tax=Papilio xuthus TaxID=66420 RepID=A0A194Q5Q0_PAPXU|nr:UDP-glucuronosyltransferase 2B15 [Papilio xuthus]